jgi:hypothetical protein
MTALFNALTLYDEKRDVQKRFKVDLLKVIVSRILFDKQRRTAFQSTMPTNMSVRL